MGVADHPQCLTSRASLEHLLSTFCMPSILPAAAGMLGGTGLSSGSCQPGDGGYPLMASPATFPHLPPHLGQPLLPCPSLGSAQLVCAVLGYPACPAGGSMRGWSATVPSGPTRGPWWRGSSLTLSTAPRITTTTSPSCGSRRRSTSQVRHWPGASKLRAVVSEACPGAEGGG